MNLLALLFDGSLAILLIVTIGYCAKLSRRIRLLQDGRSELAGMITQFDQATGRAVASLAELQTVSKRITEALHLKIEKANFLADDLAFLIEKSTKLAGQIEQANARAAELAALPKAKPPEPSSFYKAPAATAKPKLSTYPSAMSQNPDISPSIPSAATLEALLNRLGAQGTGGTQSSTPAKSSSQPPRTDAERELLAALKGR